jgi:hypothetical protein
MVDCAVVAFWHDKLNHMSRVYGDSTPFPYDIDYIELLRQALDCAVQLLSAQQSINVAAERFSNIELGQRNARTQLGNIGDAVAVAMAHFQAANDERISRVAALIAERAAASVEDAQRGFDDELSGLAGQTRTIVDRAREGAYRGVEALLRGHDIPGSMLSLRLTGTPETYLGKVGVRTPFGIDAVYSLSIPPEHVWARPRRVMELTQGAEIHVPRESGWLSKKTELTATKLDRLFIAEASLGEMQSMVKLRKAPDSGSGYQLSVNLEREPRTVLQLLREDGTLGSEPALALGNEDGSAVLGLWRRLADSMQDLFGRRQSMLSAEFDERALREVDSPRQVAERIIQELAPLTVEIARRSGAPGELVLRRDLGEGRREETYATKAELREKTLVLPPDLRVVFDPLGLNEAPRMSFGASQPEALRAVSFSPEGRREASTHAGSQSSAVPISASSLPE